MDDVTNRLIVTKRLILMTALAVLGVTAIFGVTLLFNQRLMISHLAFSCGIIGGFVSMQQRLKNIGQEELRLLAQSWFQIVLVPIFGGVFAVVLYCMFLSGIVAGDLFPKFSMPTAPKTGPDATFMQAILTQTYPLTGADLAKFLFWSFVAGFSERFVLRFVDSAASSANPEKLTDDAPAIDGDAPQQHQQAPNASRYGAPIPLNPGQN